MQNKNDNMKEAMRLAATPAGQQLIQLLQASGGASIEQARLHAANGNMEQAKAALSELLKSPRVQQLMKQMEKGHE